MLISKQNFIYLFESIEHGFLTQKFFFAFSWVSSEKFHPRSKVLSLWIPFHCQTTVLFSSLPSLSLPLFLFLFPLLLRCHSLFFSALNLVLSILSHFLFSIFFKFHSFLHHRLDRPFDKNGKYGKRKKLPKQSWEGEGGAQMCFLLSLSSFPRFLLFSITWFFFLLVAFFASQPALSILPLIQRHRDGRAERGESIEKQIGKETQGA